MYTAFFDFLCYLKEKDWSYKNQDWKKQASDRERKRNGNTFQQKETKQTLQ